MRLPFLKQPGKTLPAPFSLYLKSGAILFLFIVSVLIVSCGSNAGADLGQPSVTVTINLDGSSPTPPLPEYSCSAWVTNATPGFNTTGVVPVYAKFVHNVNGNPEGIGGATAVAQAQWYDGSTTTVSATTTSDGLAVFPIFVGNRSADLNKFTIVTVTFSKPGVPNCSVTGDQAVFFTLVIATPMPSATATGTPINGTQTPGPSVTPTQCVPGAVPVRKTPTPEPSPTPNPCHP